MNTEANHLPNTPTRPDSRSDVSHEAATTKKKINRIPRIKRGPQSVRPGLKSTSANAVPRAIVLTIPSASLTGNAEEREKLDELGHQMTDVLVQSTITQSAVVQGKWTLAVTLANPDELEDDDLFSQAFARTLPVFEKSAALAPGFVAGAKPSWKCTRGGVRVDSGFF